MGGGGWGGGWGGGGWGDPVNSKTHTRPSSYFLLKQLESEDEFVTYNVTLCFSLFLIYVFRYFIFFQMM